MLKLITYKTYHHPISVELKHEYTKIANIQCCKNTRSHRLINLLTLLHITHSVKPNRMKKFSETWPFL